MIDKKYIKVRKDARFVITIDENFNNVNLVDLKNGSTRLNQKESYDILKCCLGAIKYIVNMIEIKAKYKEKEQERK